MYLSSIQRKNLHPFIILFIITLFKSITMLCGVDGILQNIPHIHSECGD